MINESYFCKIMKRLSGHIVLLALALCYVLSSMGYGVHHCDHDGSNNLVLCYGESPCEHCHEHDACSKVHSSGHCCSCTDAMKSYSSDSKQTSGHCSCNEQNNCECNCAGNDDYNVTSKRSCNEQNNCECNGAGNDGKSEVCSEACTCEYHHSSKCCHTRIFRISNEQVPQEAVHCPEAGVSLLAFITEASYLNSACCSADFVCGQIPAPPLISGNPINVLHSQFLI